MRTRTRHVNRPSKLQLEMVDADWRWLLTALADRRATIKSISVEAMKRGYDASTSSVQRLRNRFRAGRLTQPGMLAVIQQELSAHDDEALRRRLRGVCANLSGGVLVAITAAAVWLSKMEPVPGRKSPPRRSALCAGGRR